MSRETLGVVSTCALLAGCASGLPSARVIAPGTTTAAAGVVVVPNGIVPSGEYGSDTDTGPIVIGELHVRRGVTRLIDAGIAVSHGLAPTFTRASATALTLDTKAELLCSARWAVALALPVSFVVGDRTESTPTELAAVPAPTLVAGARLGRRVELVTAAMLGVIVPVRSQYVWTTTQLTYGFGVGARIGGSSRWTLVTQLSAMASLHAGRIPGHPDEDDVDDGAVFAIAGVALSRRFD